MIAGLADTHTALWHLFDDPRLSDAAREFIDEAAVTRRKIAVSSISLAEVVYLVEKNRLPVSAYDELAQVLVDPEHVFTEAFSPSLSFNAWVECRVPKCQICQIACLLRPLCI